MFTAYACRFTGLVIMFRVTRASSVRVGKFLGQAAEAAILAMRAIIMVHYLKLRYIGIS